MLIFFKCGDNFIFSGIVRKVDYKVLKFLLPLVIVIDLSLCLKV